MPQMRTDHRQFSMPELRVSGDAGHKGNGTVEGGTTAHAFTARHL